ncbi:hypothetical protein LTR27_006905 [Elasticomyces elasticus]|nr:hypothetical protein LTR27_006905 [Elasticomyces elasticus]
MSAATPVAFSSVAVAASAPVTAASPAKRRTGQSTRRRARWSRIPKPEITRVALESTLTKANTPAHSSGSKVIRRPDILISSSVLASASKSVNDSQFEDLPITPALGFPLGYSPNATGLSHCMNTVIQLFVDIDTTSSRFGTAMKVPVGGACLARQDRKYMRILHVEALINYVEAANQEIALVPEREKSGEKVDREEIVERLLTPEAFARAFETFKQDKVINGEAWWADLECPVKVRGEEEEEK